MTIEDCLDRFAGHLLPAGLPEGLMAQLRALARAEVVQRRRASTFDPQADHFVFVASGLTKLLALDAKGSEQILAFQFAGECVHLPRATLHTYRLAAIRKADLLVFDAADLRALAADIPALADALAACSLSALHRARENLVAIGRRSASERVASFLMAMREVAQVAGEDGLALTLEMTRKEIADCLGLTVETVSRQFTRLRDLGLIATPSRTRVILTDPMRLASCAGALAPAT